MLRPIIKQPVPICIRGIGAMVHQQLHLPTTRRDHFSFDDNKKFIEHTNALAKETGITICHETHRSRILFAAHVARKYIEK